MSNPKAPVFVREATGLVRQISTVDALFANLSFVAIPYGIVSYITGPYIFPGYDPLISTILSLIFCAFIVLMYTLFVWAMPRTGGDYVWTSRILHPLVGFVSNFQITIWAMFFAGVGSNFVTTLAISPSILVAGTLLGDQNLIGLAATIAQPQNVTIIGVVVTAVSAFLTIRGVRAILTFNNFLFLISLLGFGVTLFLLASNSNADFSNAFGKFASYNGILNAAHGYGYSPQGDMLSSSLGMMPFIYLSLGFAIGTGYFAGEIKSVKRNTIVSQLGGVLIAGVLFLLIGVYSTRVFGYDFLGSISYLSATGAKEYPFGVPPYLNLFVSMLTNNPGLIYFLGLSYACSVLALIPPSYMIVTRNVFAWSFDRLIPTKFSAVSDRTHAPIFAVALMAVGQLVGLIAYTYGPAFFVSLVAGGGMGETITVIVVAIAAIIFPFVKKDLFKNSPANVKILRVPLISISGFLSLIFLILVEYFFLTNGLYGANVPAVYLTVILFLAIPCVIYFASRSYYSRKGLDISLAFKQIPPE